ncbi:hypothetical protein BGX26_005986 [Mortierella sp. AD094]|nr:hypothetical protein BGX26_005986 [Mortierella sp. AD094]
MTNEITLFCIVDGDSTAFSIDIIPGKTIDHLKDAIKKKKAPEFDDIAADKLTLWYVSIPIGDDDDDDIPIVLANYANARKLRATSEISEVFGASLPKKTIHVIVQRTSAVLNPEVAALRKQLSDMEHINAELRNTSVALGIVHKRDGRKVVCQYFTDTKTATLEDLRQLLQKHFEQFDGDDYIQIYVYAGSPSPVLLTSDHQLRSILERAQQKSWRNLTISLDSPAKNFSSWTWKEIVNEYGVRESPELLPVFDIQPKPLLTEDEKVVLEHIVRDCTFKNEAYLFGSSASEATRSTIVDAFMVGAMHFYKSDMYMAQQQQMSGMRGHGPVDFAVIDRIHQSQILGVTEVKKDDHVQGLAQNMVQLDVAVQQKKRKRVEEADEDSRERAPVRFKSYGIVTDSFKWTFVECTLDEDDTVTYRTKEVQDNLKLKHGEKSLREGCEIIFANVLALYELMRDEIVNRSSNSNSGSRSPSTKRVATGGDRQSRAL